VHQGRIGEIIQAKPEQRRRVLEEAAGISGLHARRHEAELRLRAAEQNLTRLEDVIGQLAAQVEGLKRQSRQAVRYRAISEQVRKAEATLFHLRFVNANGEVNDAQHAKDVGTRVLADRTGAQAEASKRQALAAAALPELRDAEAKAAAAAQRIIAARDALDREEARAKERIAELDLRLKQLDEDIEREKRLAADAEASLARLVTEKEGLSQEAKSSASRRTDVEKSVVAAEATLTQTEKTFGELTAALADLSAQRNQLENALREHGERRARIERELAGVQDEVKKLEA
jgi:chromosome segregation protein